MALGALARSDQEDVLWGAPEGIFENDAILPEQFADLLRPACTNLQPEKMLMLAVLQDALWYFSKNLGRRTYDMQSLLGWFASADRMWPFSFENICDGLEIDAERCRKHIHDQLAGNGRSNGKNSKWSCCYRPISRKGILRPKRR